MLRSLTRVLRQAATAGGGGRGGSGGASIPSAGSSLRNPRSRRAKLRRAMAAGAAQQASFEEQVSFADIGGTGDGSRPARGKSFFRPKSRRQRGAHQERRVGARVAEDARHMTDAEWEAVPMEDKHAFTKYMSQLLRERPTQASEQQRRRYFETTMVDPRDLDPATTVQDPYERVKLGLPVQLKDPQRTMGVTDALFESSEASLFDKDRTHELENAMTEVKQVFADYMRGRREGVSTEAERRRLAHLTAELNAETQKHLASMFKSAEERLRTAALAERREQLRELARLRQAAAREGGPRARRARRRDDLKRAIHKAVGLDVDVVDSILTELRAQEEFLQFCEVFARLTVGQGFEHRRGDEGLDAYTESLKRLYSADADTISSLDVVQYLAAKEDAHPVEWARRWYERAVLLPLQNTPEYQRLEAIRQRDAEALRLQAELRAAGGGAEEAEQQAVELKQRSAVDLAEKMFMRADDPRLRSLHEKRLRYLAYLQMERQIKKARQNARIFSGVENLPEAAECRALYQQLLDRRQALPDSSSTNNNNSNSNLYTNDATAVEIFEKIRDITLRVIKAQKRRSRTEAKAAQAAALLRGLQDRHGGAERLRETLEARRRALSERLLGIMEADVRSDVEWLEAMEEAQRPPLLPVPEDGMSYVSAADVAAWAEVRRGESERAADPFAKGKRGGNLLAGATLFGQPWSVPDRPMLFWGTGTRAVQQALQHAAEDAERERRGEPLAPPYPCAENPWGWRLAKDILDD